MLQRTTSQMLSLLSQREKPREKTEPDRKRRENNILPSHIIKQLIVIPILIDSDDSEEMIPCHVCRTLQLQNRFSAGPLSLFPSLRDDQKSFVKGAFVRRLWNKRSSKVDETVSRT